MDIQFLQHHLLKTLFSFHQIVLEPCGHQLPAAARASFSAVSSVCFTCMSVLMACLTRELCFWSVAVSPWMTGWVPQGLRAAPTSPVRDPRECGTGWSVPAAPSHLEKTWSSQRDPGLCSPEPPEDTPSIVMSPWKKEDATFLLSALKPLSAKPAPCTGLPLPPKNWKIPRMLFWLEH